MAEQHVTHPSTLPTAPDRGLVRQKRRLIGLAVALPIAGVLSVAAGLTPSADGHGTHTQLGMPKCQWVSFFDKPCATCGMTTSFSLAADGRMGASFLNQPMGMVLAVVSAAVLWGALHVMVTGVRLSPVTRFVVGRGTVVLAVAGLLGAWAYKVAIWS